jgi:glycosyltransferase involved in cell wall biosynthesis
VRFTGYLREEDVRPTLASATVVVLPYTSTTGSSGVLHQVGEVGRAAVLPNIGDLAELIRCEGYAGEFFEPGSAESLANSIERILNDEPYRTRLETENFRASQACSIGSVAARYVDEIELTRQSRKKTRA